MNNKSYDTIFEEQDENDRNVLLANFYNKKIEEEKAFLKKNQNEQEKLREKLNYLKEQLDDINEENDDLEENSTCPDFQKLSLTGDFFQQLRMVEAAKEVAESQIQGLKQCINDLQSEIQVNNNKYNRMMAQNEDLKQRILAAESLRGNRESDLRIEKDKVGQLQLEEDKLKDMLINIKDASRKKADQIKKSAQESVGEIYTQREVLLNAIEEKKAKIAQLKEQKKEEKRNSIVAEVRRQEIKKSQNYKAWINERSALIAKVKKARLELQSIKRRNKNVAKHATKASTPTLKKSSIPKSNINLNQLTDDVIKKALLLETQEIKNTDTKFLREALKTEENYETQLQNELEQIDNTIDQISNFKDSTVDLMNQQKQASQNPQRINMLRQELKELQSKL